MRGRLSVVLACVVVTAGLAARSSGGTTARGGCLDGKPTAAFLAGARTLARSAGERPLPTHAPPTATYARFCVYPVPKSATDTTPGTGYPTLGFYRTRLQPLLGASLGPYKVGTTIAGVLSHNPERRWEHKTVHLGKYAAVHVFAKPDPNRTFPCLQTEWLLRGGACSTRAGLREVRRRRERLHRVVETGVLSGRCELAARGRDVAAAREPDRRRQTRRVEHRLERADLLT